MKRLRSLNNSKGFTLLELLVALVLVGIILSFATLSLDTGEDRKIKEEARRITSLIKLAQEESILNNRILFLNINTAGYQFTYLNPDREEAKKHPERNEIPMEDSVFRAREFAEYVHLDIKVENLQFNTDADKKEKDDSVFKILIYPSGEISPFKISFPTNDIDYEIIGSIQGVVELISHIKDS